MNVASLMNRTPEGASTPQRLKLLQVQVEMLTQGMVGATRESLRRVEQTCRTRLLHARDWAAGARLRQ